jgi:hypothetical protein
VRAWNVGGYRHFWPPSHTTPDFFFVALPKTVKIQKALPSEACTYSAATYCRPVCLTHTWNMHHRLEQCWELTRAGKAIYDFDAAYHASQEPAVSPTTQRFPRSYLEIAPLGRPPVNPETVKRPVEQSRADEARRRNEPHVRRLKEVCGGVTPSQFRTS